MLEIDDGGVLDLTVLYHRFSTKVCSDPEVCLIYFRASGLRM